MKKDNEETKGEGFLNESDLKFTDISSEICREYTFSDGKKLLIGKPLYLHVSASGGHRLFSHNEETGNYFCWYIQPREGWYIKWCVRSGRPNFVK